MGVKDFYEKMYGDERTDKPKSPFLYRKLRKFELKCENKYYKVYKILTREEIEEKDKIRKAIDKFLATSSKL